MPSENNDDANSYKGDYEFKKGGCLVRESLNQKLDADVALGSEGIG